jgi:hypothetical protein
MWIPLGSWRQIYLLFTKVEDLLTIQAWVLIVKEDPRPYLQTIVSKLNKVTKFACFTHEKFIHVRSLSKRTSFLELVIQSVLLESSKIVI